MKLSAVSTLVVALAAQGTIASTWFGKPAYNKWHETELERWLSDHNIAHPKAADRKELQDLVKKNWNDNVVTPYNTWDTLTMQNYLTVKGQKAKKGTEKDTKSLAEQVKLYWTETEDSANSAYGDVKNWIFDSWTDSQLKAFADKHGIPVPQPRERDSLLKSVRENYQSVANKASETTAYPGDWLYASWSDSDLKAWFDERGYKVPQPSSRDKLIANIRRNSRLASLNAKGAYSSVTSSAAAAQQSLSDALLDSWSDSQIKEWADKNGIKVPQGSKRNELLALARKHRAQLYGDNISASASSAYGAASGSAASAYGAASGSAASAASGASGSAASAYGAATSQAGNAQAQATNGFAGYTNWIKAQIGLATGYGASASSASVSAQQSASSASDSISKSASSASGAASQSAQSGYDAAAASVKSGYDAAAASAKSATARVKEEL